MKSPLLKLLLLPVFITSCTNVTVQAPPATVPTVATAKAPPEQSQPVTRNPVVEASAPTQSGSSCNYFAGRAVEGQAVNVNLCSVSPRSSGAIAFSYSLGSQQMDSEANCASGTWTTFRDGQTHRPQSSATEKMLDRVCGNRGSSQISSQSSTSQSGAAIVFDPPSNVRTSPNGEILCSIQKRTTINIYGSSGSWYNTDACGTMGVISKDQIRF